MTTLGLGYIILTFFHLLTHALFKSLLFLCAGNLISNNHHRQDLRSVGLNYLPLSIVSIFVSCISLIGLPFLRGFYSKDMILEISF